MTGSFFAVLIFLAIRSVSGFSYGHGPALSIENHLPNRDLKVAVGVVSSEEMVQGALAIFDIGSGQKLVVYSEGTYPYSNHALNEVLWKKGHALVFSEDRNKGEDSGELLWQKSHFSLYLMKAALYRKLANDPYKFIDPIAKQGRFDAPAREAKPSKQGLRLDSRFEVDASNLLKYLRQLSGEEDVVVEGTPVRIVDRGSKEPRQLLHQFLIEYFTGLGLEVEKKCYRQSWYNGCNIQATKIGQDPSREVLVTAHIDSVRNKGADDDGSGTAAMMEIARLVASSAPLYSIKFVGFDQEELGLIGSRAYVQELDNNSDSIIGVLQADMIGYDGDKDSAIHVMDCDRQDSKFLKDGFVSVAKALGHNFQLVEDCTNRSDHASFWKKNIPAVLISENFFGGDENPCYHRTCDQINLINLPYMAKISEVMVNFAWALANP